MDTIEDRLHDTSKNCFECYQEWIKDKKNIETREKLQVAIHELRKVASRLEIDLATTERDEMTKRALPVPPHRDAKRRTEGAGGDRRHNNKGKKDNSGNKDAPPEIKKRTPRAKKTAGE